MQSGPSEDHKAHVAALRRMTPGERLRIAFEITERAKAEYLAQLALRHPTLDRAGVTRLYVEQLLQRDERRGEFGPFELPSLD